jgi:hypothetical protein
MMTGLNTAKLALWAYHRQGGGCGLINIRHAASTGIAVVEARCR